MKNIVILSFIIRLSCHQLPGQSTEAFSQAVAELSSSNVAIRNSPEGCDSFMCEMIKRADENYSTKK